MSFHYLLPNPDFNEQIKLNYSSYATSSSSIFSASSFISSVTSGSSSSSSSSSSSKYENIKDQTDFELNIPYTAFEVLVGVIAVIGNLMVIIVFKRDRKLRRRTNYYIVSLAVADFLVGLLGVPFAILSSIGEPKNLYACLLSLSTLVVLCTISIFCLVAVSVDRYWAILHPMAYSRNVRTKTAIGIISMCWVAGTIVGLMPLFGFHQPYQDSCFFEKTMDYNFLLFLYFATIITPAFLMLCFYAHIYRVIVKQIRQIVTMNPIGSRRSSRLSVYDPQQIKTICNNTGNTSRGHGGTMLRVLGAARKRDVKATQNLSIIVLFFMICWIPLYTINCITAFNRDIKIPDQIKMCCIILTHLNSAVNPILYAYHLKDFRAALKNLILKVFGIEVQQPPDIQYKLSVASQHRLHSLSRSSFQNRIYVDSPIWLKQKQMEEQLQSNNRKNATITRSLNSVHQTVAAVASATADRDMWKIVEIPSIINEESLRLQSECDLSSFKNAHYISSEEDDDIDEEPSQTSYDNKNFSTSADNLSINNRKITQEPRKSITLALIRQQLQLSKSNPPTSASKSTELKPLDFLRSSFNSCSSLKKKKRQNKEETEPNFTSKEIIQKRFSASSTSSNYSYSSSSSEDFIKHESYRKLDSHNLPTIYHIRLDPSDTITTTHATSTGTSDIKDYPKSSANKANSLRIMKRLSYSNDQLDSSNIRNLDSGKNNHNYNYRLYNSQPRKKILYNPLDSTKININNQLMQSKHYSLFQICDYFKEKDDANGIELKSGRKRTLSSES